MVRDTRYLTELTKVEKGIVTVCCAVRDLIFVGKGATCGKGTSRKKRREVD